jgi:hypothetical protein
MIGCMLRWCAKKKIDTVGDGFGECKSGACGAAELGGGYRKPEGPYHPTTMNICQRSCANSGPCSGSGQNANTIFHELAHLCDINTKQHPNLPYRDRPEEIRAFCFGDALSEFYRSV